jgi:hypothetical protein
MPRELPDTIAEVPFAVPKTDACLARTFCGRADCPDADAGPTVTSKAAGAHIRHRFWRQGFKLASFAREPIIATCDEAANQPRR